VKADLLIASQVLQSSNPKSSHTLHPCPELEITVCYYGEGIQDQVTSMPLGKRCAWSGECVTQAANPNRFIKNSWQSSEL